jgi:hypothetical protein
MTADSATFAWLVLLCVPLLALTRWLSLHLQGLGLLLSGSQQTALLLHYLVLLPGILLHEASHWVAAKLVGVKTKSISLRPKSRSGGSVRFGSVTVVKSDPFRESWIGLAPLLTGTAAILALARWQFGIESVSPLTLQGIADTLAASLKAPDALLGVYLIFAVSNAMWPSESDRQPWGMVVLLLGLGAGIFYVAGLIPQLAAGVGQWVRTAVDYLAFAFALAVSVDIPFALLILLAEKTAERALGRHVEY